MSQRGTGGPSDWRVDKNGQEYYDDQRTRTRIYRDAHGEYYIDPQTRRRVYLGARGKQTPRFVPTSASAIPSQQVPPPRSDHGPTGPTQRVPVSQPSSPPQTLRLPILPSSDDQKTTKQASYQLKPPSHPTDMTGINAAFGGLAILPASEPGTNRPISGNALGKRPMSNIPPMRTNQALQAIAGAQSASSAALSQPGPSGAPRMDNVASQRQNQILDEGTWPQRSDLNDSRQLTPIEYKLRKHPNKYFKIGKVCRTERKDMNNIADLLEGILDGTHRAIRAIKKATAATRDSQYTQSGCIRCSLWRACFQQGPAVRCRSRGRRFVSSSVSALFDGTARIC